MLLSVVLVVSMTSNAAPKSVLAQEGSGQQESVSGNTQELPEGGAKPAEGADSGDQKDPEVIEGEEETNLKNRSRMTGQEDHRQDRRAGSSEKYRPEKYKDLCGDPCP